ncbi:MAG: restriction endonuclease subunit M [Eubacteriaceae bacterium]
MEITIVDILEEDILELGKPILENLLKDRTTRKNIIWATNDYLTLGEGYDAKSSIIIEQITGRHSDVIQPRVAKARELQTNRTRDKAEVFTPSWICNEQNNLIDEQWFGRKDVFNKTLNKSWVSTTDKIIFMDDLKKTWKTYVDANRLEIACGEAPYLVSRYDTVTGNTIPINDRIGLLDRKLRIVNENTSSEKDWLKWATRAIQSTYGFEYQGDSLLLARENVLYTFIDNMECLMYSQKQ